jgi:hypothetical protein
LHHAAEQRTVARQCFDPIVLEDAEKAARDAREALNAVTALGFAD